MCDPERSQEQKRRHPHEEADIELRSQRRPSAGTDTLVSPGDGRPAGGPDIPDRTPDQFPITPQDPDIYSDPQPSIQAPEPPQEPKTPEVVPEVQTTTVAVQATETTHSHKDGLTFEHALTSDKNGTLCIDGVPQVGNDINPSRDENLGNYMCYYLADDLKLNGSLKISSGRGINLCLNGHSIKQTGNVDAITVDNYNVVNLYDCSENNKGQVTHTDGATGRGIKFFASAVNTFNMYGGTITGNHATAKNDDTGGGVLVTGSAKGSFNLRGGVITGNSAANGGGVAVCSTQSNNKDTSR